MISNVLDYNFDRYTAATLPRMQPRRDDFIIEIEARIPEQVVCGLAKLGGKLSLLAPYSKNMGSYQQRGVSRRLDCLARGMTPDLRATLAASETIELRLERRRWARVRWLAIQRSGAACA
jgi:hypothetical protein